jgi:hypothetical protein
LKKSHNGLNLNYLNDYSSEYIFESLLPSSYNLGTTNNSQSNSLNSNNTTNQNDILNITEITNNQIILMASIKDSLGGITNLTLPVKVT